MNDELHSLRAEIQEIIARRQAPMQELYDQLMTLCATNDAFYFADHERNEQTFMRVFAYRMGSYSDFLLPGALEARGIMFQVDARDEKHALCIKSRPPAKFFNIGENPLTLDLDYEKVTDSFIKEDGSLISTWNTAVMGMGEDFETQCEFVLRLKSKTSTSSDQVKAAMAWLNTKPDFRDKLLQRDCAGWTVNCEWCAPDNRIVVGYLTPQLIVLNVRNKITGEYAPREELEIEFGPYLVKRGPMIRCQADIDELATHTGYEGVILEFENGYRVKHVKFKNAWYLHRHRTKDSVNNVNSLFDAVLHEASDDLKGLFVEDPLAMQRIEEMEQLVIPLYNSYVKGVETFVAQHKHLDRKDFAILAQQEFPQAHSPLNKISFSAMMSLYQGKAPSYKELLSKHKRSFITMTDEVVD